MTKHISYQSSLILVQALNVPEILKNYPELVNLKSLRSDQKVALLREDDENLTKFILDSNLSSQDFFHIIWEMPKAFSKKHGIVLTLEHVKSLDHHKYSILLKSDFEKYFMPDKWEKIPTYLQTEIFLKEYEYFFKNKVPYPKLTKNTLRSISASAVNRYFSESDIEKLSVDYNFWQKLISYKPDIYKPMFVRLMKKVSNATELRGIFWSNPDLIKMVKISDLEKTKLSLKQWVLLFNSIVGNEADKVKRSRGKKPHVNIFDGWSFDQGFVADMELSLTLEMLNGKSKVTKQFTNAMEFLKTLKIMDEKEDETTTV